MSDREKVLAEQLLLDPGFRFPDPDGSVLPANPDPYSLLGPLITYGLLTPDVNGMDSQGGIPDYTPVETPEWVSREVARLMHYVSHVDRIATASGVMEQKGMYVASGLDVFDTRKSEDIGGNWSIGSGLNEALHDASWYRTMPTPDQQAENIAKEQPAGGVGEEPRSLDRIGASRMKALSMQNVSRIGGYDTTKLAETSAGGIVPRPVGSEETEQTQLMQQYYSNQLDVFTFEKGLEDSLETTVVAAASSERQEENATDVPKRAVFRRRRTDGGGVVATGVGAEEAVKVGGVPRVSLPMLASEALERLALQIQHETLKTPYGERSQLRVDLSDVATKCLDAFHTSYGSVCHLPDEGLDRKMAYYFVEMHVTDGAVQVRLGQSAETLRAGKEKRPPTPAASGICGGAAAVKQLLNTSFPEMIMHDGGGKDGWISALRSDLHAAAQDPTDAPEQTAEAMESSETLLNGMQQRLNASRVASFTRWVEVGTIDSTELWTATSRPALAERVAEVLGDDSVMDWNVVYVSEGHMQEGLQFKVRADAASTRTAWPLLYNSLNSDLLRADAARFGLAASPTLKEGVSIEFPEYGAKERASVFAMMETVYELKMVLQWVVLDPRADKNHYARARKHLIEKEGGLLGEMVRRARAATVAFAFPQSERDGTSHGYKAAQAVYGIGNAIWIACIRLSESMEKDKVGFVTVDCRNRADLLLGLLHMMEGLWGVRVCETVISNMTQSATQVIMDDLLALWLVPVEGMTSLEGLRSDEDRPDMGQTDAGVTSLERSVFGEKGHEVEHRWRCAQKGLAMEALAADLLTSGETTNADWAGLHRKTTMNLQEVQMLLENVMHAISELQQEMCATSVHTRNVNCDWPSPRVNMRMEMCVRSLLLGIMYISTNLTLAERGSLMGEMAYMYAKVGGMEKVLLQALNYAQESHTMLMNAYIQLRALSNFGSNRKVWTEVKHVTMTVKTTVQQAIGHLKNASDRVFPRFEDESRHQHDVLSRQATTPIAGLVIGTKDEKLRRLHVGSTGLFFGPGSEDERRRTLARKEWPADSETLQKRLKTQVALATPGKPAPIVAELLKRPVQKQGADMSALLKRVLKIAVGAIETVKNGGIGVESVEVSLDSSAVFEWHDLVLDALKSRYGGAAELTTACLELVCHTGLAAPVDVFGALLPSRKALWLAVAKPIMAGRFDSLHDDEAAATLAAIVLCNVAMGVGGVLPCDRTHAECAMAEEGQQHISGTIAAAGYRLVASKFTFASAECIVASPSACLREPGSAHSGFCAETASGDMDGYMVDRLHERYGSGLCKEVFVDAHQTYRDNVQRDLLEMKKAYGGSGKTGVAPVDVLTAAIQEARAFGCLNMQVISSQIVVPTQNGLDASFVYPSYAGWVVLRAQHLAGNEKRVEMDWNQIRKSVFDVLNDPSPDAATVAALKRGIVPLPPPATRSLESARSAVLVVLGAKMQQLGIHFLDENVAVVNGDMLDTLETALAGTSGVPSGASKVTKVTLADDPLDDTEIMEKLFQVTSNAVADSKSLLSARNAAVEQSTKVGTVMGLALDGDKPNSQSAYINGRASRHLVDAVGNEKSENAVAASFDGVLSIMYLNSEKPVTVVDSAVFNGDDRAVMFPTSRGEVSALMRISALRIEDGFDVRVAASMAELPSISDTILNVQELVTASFGVPLSKTSDIAAPKPKKARGAAVAPAEREEDEEEDEEDEDEDEEEEEEDEDEEEEEEEDEEEASQSRRPGRGRKRAARPARQPSQGSRSGGGSPNVQTVASNEFVGAVGESDTAAAVRRQARALLNVPVFLAEGEEGWDEAEYAVENPLAAIPLQCTLDEEDEAEPEPVDGYEFTANGDIETRAAARARPTNRNGFGASTQPTEMLAAVTFIIGGGSGGGVQATRLRQILNNDPAAANYGQRDINATEQHERIQRMTELRRKAGTNIEALRAEARGLGINFADLGIDSERDNAPRVEALRGFDDGFGDFDDYGDFGGDFGGDGFDDGQDVGLRPVGVVCGPRRDLEKAPSSTWGHCLLDSFRQILGNAQEKQLDVNSQDALLECYRLRLVVCDWFLGIDAAHPNGQALPTKGNGQRDAQGWGAQDTQDPDQRARYDLVDGLFSTIKRGEMSETRDWLRTHLARYNSETLFAYPAPDAQGNVPYVNATRDELETLRALYVGSGLDYDPATSVSRGLGYMRWTSFEEGVNLIFEVNYADMVFVTGSAWALRIGRICIYHPTDANPNDPNPHYQVAPLQSGRVYGPPDGQGEVCIAHGGSAYMHFQPLVPIGTALRGELGFRAASQARGNAGRNITDETADDDRLLLGQWVPDQDGYGLIEVTPEMLNLAQQQIAETRSILPMFQGARILAYSGLGTLFAMGTGAVAAAPVAFLATAGKAGVSQLLVHQALERNASKRAANMEASLIKADVTAKKQGPRKITRADLAPFGSDALEDVDVELNDYQDQMRKLVRMSGSLKDAVQHVRQMYKRTKPMSDALDRFDTKLYDGDLPALDRRTVNGLAYEFWTQLGLEGTKTLVRDYFLVQFYGKTLRQQPEFQPRILSDFEEMWWWASPMWQVMNALNAQLENAQKDAIKLKKKKIKEHDAVDKKIEILQEKREAWELRDERGTMSRENFRKKKAQQLEAMQKLIEVQERNQELRRARINRYRREVARHDTRLRFLTERELFFKPTLGPDVDSMWVEAGMARMAAAALAGGVSGAIQGAVLTSAMGRVFGMVLGKRAGKIMDKVSKGAGGVASSATGALTSAIARKSRLNRTRPKSNADKLNTRLLALQAKENVLLLDLNKEITRLEREQRRRGPRQLSIPRRRTLAEARGRKRLLEQSVSKGAVQLERCLASESLVPLNALAFASGGFLGFFDLSVSALFRGYKLALERERAAGVSGVMAGFKPFLPFAGIVMGLLKPGVLYEPGTESGESLMRGVLEVSRFAARCGAVIMMHQTIASYQKQLKNQGDSRYVEAKSWALSFAKVGMYAVGIGMAADAAKELGVLQNFLGTVDTTTATLSWLIRSVGGAKALQSAPELLSKALETGSPSIMGEFLSGTAAEAALMGTLAHEHMMGTYFDVLAYQVASDEAAQREVRAESLDAQQAGGAVVESRESWVQKLRDNPKYGYAAAIFTACSIGQAITFARVGGMLPRIRHLGDFCQHALNPSFGGKAFSMMQLIGKRSGMSDKTLAALTPVSAVISHVISEAAFKPAHRMALRRVAQAMNAGVDALNRELGNALGSRLWSVGELDHESEMLMRMFALVGMEVSAPTGTRSFADVTRVKVPNGATEEEVLAIQAQQTRRFVEMWGGYVRAHAGAAQADMMRYFNELDRNGYAKQMWQIISIGMLTSSLASGQRSDEYYADIQMRDLPQGVSEDSALRTTIQYRYAFFENVLADLAETPALLSRASGEPRRPPRISAVLETAIGVTPPSSVTPTSGVTPPSSALERITSILESPPPQSMSELLSTAAPEVALSTMEAVIKRSAEMDLKTALHGEQASAMYYATMTILNLEAVGRKSASAIMPLVDKFGYKQYRANSDVMVKADRNVQRGEGIDMPIALSLELSTMGYAKTYLYAELASASGAILVPKKNVMAQLSMQSTMAKIGSSLSSKEKSLYVEPPAGSAIPVAAKEYDEKDTSVIRLLADEANVFKAIREQSQPKVPLALEHLANAVGAAGATNLMVPMSGIASFLTDMNKVPFPAQHVSEMQVTKREAAPGGPSVNVQQTNIPVFLDGLKRLSYNMTFEMLDAEPSPASAKAEALWARLGISVQRVSGERSFQFVDAFAVNCLFGTDDRINGKTLGSDERELPSVIDYALGNLDRTPSKQIALARAMTTETSLRLSYAYAATHSDRRDPRFPKETRQTLQSDGVTYAPERVSMHGTDVVQRKIFEQTIRDLIDPSGDVASMCYVFNPTGSVMDRSKKFVQAYHHMDLARSCLERALVLTGGVLQRTAQGAGVDAPAVQAVVEKHEEQVFAMVPEEYRTILQHNQKREGFFGHYDNNASRAGPYDFDQDRATVEYVETMVFVAASYHVAALFALMPPPDLSRFQDPGNWNAFPARKRQRNYNFLMLPIQVSRVSNDQLNKSGRRQDQLYDVNDVKTEKSVQQMEMCTMSLRRAVDMVANAVVHEEAGKGGMRSYGRLRKEDGKAVTLGPGQESEMRLRAMWSGVHQIMDMLDPINLSNGKDTTRARNEIDANSHAADKQRMLYCVFGANPLYRLQDPNQPAAPASPGNDRYRVMSYREHVLKAARGIVDKTMSPTGVCYLTICENGVPRPSWATWRLFDPTDLTDPERRKRRFSSVNGMTCAHIPSRLKLVYGILKLVSALEAMGDSAVLKKIRVFRKLMGVDGVHAHRDANSDMDRKVVYAEFTEPIEMPTLETLMHPKGLVSLLSGRITEFLEAGETQSGMTLQPMCLEFEIVTAQGAKAAHDYNGYSLPPGQRVPATGGLQDTVSAKAVLSALTAATDQRDVPVTGKKASEVTAMEEMLANESLLAAMNYNALSSPLSGNSTQLISRTASSVVSTSPGESSMDTGAGYTRERDKDAPLNIVVENARMPPVVESWASVQRHAPENLEAATYAATVGALLTELHKQALYEGGAVDGSEVRQIRELMLASVTPERKSRITQPASDDALAVYTGILLGAEKATNKELRTVARIMCGMLSIMMPVEAKQTPGFSVRVSHMAVSLASFLMVTLATYGPGGMEATFVVEQLAKTVLNSLAFFGLSEAMQRQEAQKIVCLAASFIQPKSLRVKVQTHLTGDPTRASNCNSELFNTIGAVGFYTASAAVMAAWNFQTYLADHAVTSAGSALSSVLDLGKVGAKTVLDLIVTGDAAIAARNFKDYAGKEKLLEAVNTLAADGVKTALIVKAGKRTAAYIATATEDTMEAVQSLGYKTLDSPVTQAALFNAANGGGVSVGEIAKLAFLAAAPSFAGSLSFGTGSEGTESSMTSLLTRINASQLAINISRTTATETLGRAVAINFLNVHTAEEVQSEVAPRGGQEVFEELGASHVEAAQISALQELKASIDDVLYLPTAGQQRPETPRSAEVPEASVTSGWWYVSEAASEAAAYEAFLGASNAVANRVGLAAGWETLTWFFDSERPEIQRGPSADEEEENFGAGTTTRIPDFSPRFTAHTKAELANYGVINQVMTKVALEFGPSPADLERFTDMIAKDPSLELPDGDDVGALAKDPQRVASLALLMRAKNFLPQPPKSELKRPTSTDLMQQLGLKLRVLTKKVDAALAEVPQMTPSLFDRKFSATNTSAFEEVLNPDTIGAYVNKLNNYRTVYCDVYGTARWNERTLVSGTEEHRVQGIYDFIRSKNTTVTLVLDVEDVPTESSKYASTVNAYDEDLDKAFVKAAVDVLTYADMESASDANWKDVIFYKNVLSTVGALQANDEMDVSSPVYRMAQKHFEFKDLEKQENINTGEMTALYQPSAVNPEAFWRIQLGESEDLPVRHIMTPVPGRDAGVEVKFSVSDVEHGGIRFASSERRVGILAGMPTRNAAQRATATVEGKRPAVVGSFQPAFLETLRSEYPRVSDIDANEEIFDQGLKANDRLKGLQVGTTDRYITTRDVGWKTGALMTVAVSSVGAYQTGMRSTMDARALFRAAGYVARITPLEVPVVLGGLAVSAFPVATILLAERSLMPRLKTLVAPKGGGGLLEPELFERLEPWVVLMTAALSKALFGFAQRLYDRKFYGGAWDYVTVIMERNDGAMFGAKRKTKWQKITSDEEGLRNEPLGNLLFNDGEWRDYGNVSGVRSWVNSVGHRQVQLEYLCELSAMVVMNRMRTTTNRWDRTQGGGGDTKQDERLKKMEREWGLALDSNQSSAKRNQKISDGTRTAVSEFVARERLIPLDVIPSFGEKNFRASGGIQQPSTSSSVRAGMGALVGSGDGRVVVPHAQAQVLSEGTRMTNSFGEVAGNFFNRPKKLDAELKFIGFDDVASSGGMERDKALWERTWGDPLNWGSPATQLATRWFKTSAEHMPGTGSSSWVDDRMAPLRGAGTKMMDVLRRQQIEELVQMRFTCEHAEMTYLTRTIANKTSLLAPDGVWSDLEDDSTREKILDRCFQAVVGIPLERHLVRVRSEKLDDVKQLPSEFQQLRRIGLSELDHLVVLSGMSTDKVNDLKLPEGVSMVDVEGRCITESYLRRKFRTTGNAAKREAPADRGGTETATKIYQTLKKLNSCGWDGAGKPVYAPFVGFVKQSASYDMPSIDSAIMQLAGPEVGAGVNELKNVLSKAAKFTRDLENNMQRLLTADQLAASRIALIQTALDAEYVPVVRSVYGVLLPEWMVKDRKWADAYV